MSLDLQVWSPKPLHLPAQLPKSQCWTSIANDWNFSQADWRILVLTREATPEMALTQKLAGASFVTFVSLNPINADESGYKMLEETVRALAKASGGVWLDPCGAPFRHDEGDFGM